MNIKKLAGAVAATAMTFGIGAATVTPASATENIKPFGSLERMLDFTTGASTIGYTVQQIVPSFDPVAHNGQLYEATLRIDAYGSPATPTLAQFGARAENRALYPAIAAASGGLNAPLPPGGSATGKLYFDVVGAPPHSVVWGDGFRDILAWVPGPPQGGTRP